jgi:catechol 2,3-dioxygenase-like lactoylglutathione lyase family enzyme
MRPAGAVVSAHLVLPLLASAHGLQVGRCRRPLSGVVAEVVTFSGVSHAAFTVTDLDVSERFYTRVLDFVVALDAGYGRVCIHPATGFTLGLIKHEDAYGGRFCELTTGLDHLGLSASSRAELEDWQRRLDELGVSHSPIRDMELGYHLNFRDPDGIALEFDAPNELWIQARQVLATGETTPDRIAAFVTEHLGHQLVPRG